ncbi:MAG: HesB/IscA family protein [Bacillota bacterium]|uniref:HesB/IscA family protein n=1 Tax=unclassified Candidatus Desulforudis TaxID=2635950 RepID=UPI003497D79F
MALDESVNPNDTLVEINDLKFVVDSEAAKALRGCVVDYVTSWRGAGFTIKNPNDTGGCAGCGDKGTCG